MPLSISGFGISFLLHNKLIAISVELKLLYLHDRIKQIIVQIVDNDLRNNLVKFKKIHHSIFEYLKINLAFLPIEINGRLYFTQNRYGEIS